MSRSHIESRANSFSIFPPRHTAGLMCSSALLMHCSHWLEAIGFRLETFSVHSPRKRSDELHHKQNPSFWTSAFQILSSKPHQNMIAFQILWANDGVAMRQQAFAKVGGVWVNTQPKRTANPLSTAPRLVTAESNAHFLILRRRK